MYGDDDVVDPIRSPLPREETGASVNTFWIAAIIVVVLWIIILGLYLATMRRQPELRSQMEALDEQLNKLDSESGKG